jgi:thymidine kinase
MVIIRKFLLGTNPHQLDCSVRSLESAIKKNVRVILATARDDYMRFAYQCFALILKIADFLTKVF